MVMKTIKYYFAYQISKDLKLLCHGKEWAFLCIRSKCKFAKNKSVIYELMLDQETFLNTYKNKKGKYVAFVEGGRWIHECRLYLRMSSEKIFKKFKKEIS